MNIDTELMGNGTSSNGPLSPGTDRFRYGAGISAENPNGLVMKQRQTVFKHHHMSNDRFKHATHRRSPLLQRLQSLSGA